MNNQEPRVHPGYSIAAIASTAGVSFEESALGMAALLGTIAGPAAGIEGLAGELIDPAINLVHTGLPNPAWMRAQDLLLSPVQACQRMLRDLSRTTVPDRINQLQFLQFTAGRTDAIVDRCKSGVFRGEPGPPEYIPETRHFDVLRHPSFALLSPDAGTLANAMAETLERWPLVLDPDGKLFADLLKKHAALKGVPALARLLSAAMSGQDCLFPKADPRLGFGELETVKAHLLSTCTRDQLADALGSPDDDLQDIVEHCILLDSESASPPAGQMEMKDLRWGYSNYYEKIKNVLNARRAGAGLQYSLAPEAAETLRAFSAEIREWNAKLADKLRPHFRHSLNLPFRLHWSVLTSLSRGEADTWCLPFTLHLTRWVLESQRQLLEGLLLASERNDQQRARLTMLRKLLDGPCLFRDLLRRYSVQKRSLHWPVLHELIAEGLVQQREDLLELTSQGRQLAIEATTLRAA